MHSTDTKSRFIQLRAPACSLSATRSASASPRRAPARPWSAPVRRRCGIGPCPVPDLESRLEPVRSRYAYSRPSMLICGGDISFSLGRVIHWKFTAPENCTVSAPFLHQKQRFLEKDHCPSTGCKRTAPTWCNSEAPDRLTMTKSKNR